MSQTDNAVPSRPVRMWCDPREAFLTRMAFYTACGLFFLWDATTYYPWKSGSSIGETLLAIGLLIVPIVTLARSLPSRVYIDRAAGTVEIRRVAGFGFPSDEDDDNEDRFIKLADVQSVVLTPQKRPQLIWPSQLQLRLRDGRRQPVSTISSYTWLMRDGAQRLAEAINVPFEPTEVSPQP